MAITNTVIDKGTWGDKKYIYGQSVLSGGTNTGDVATGLRLVEFFAVSTYGGTQKNASVNETLPLSGGDVTVVSESNDATLYWLAIGK